MTRILVINSGSSSLKYRVFDLPQGDVVLAGSIERIGESLDGRHAGVGAADHAEALSTVFLALSDAGIDDIDAVGHRVVHGGHEFSQPTLVTDQVLEAITALSNLAPLHNPANVAAIAAARKHFPRIPHIAVFDTAFHHTIPPEAYTYAIDREVAREFGIRRYGFHGTSHEAASHRAASFLQRPIESLKQIILHLGNGASMTAVEGGKSVDTSMGMTPLEGLVMGSRAGDIDPGALIHLLRTGHYTAESLDDLLNERSGLLGMSGLRDIRDLLHAIEAGDADSDLALDVYVHRIRHYLGAYLVELGGADVIVFTGGIGEHRPQVRSRILESCEWLGISLDHAANGGVMLAETDGIARISAADSATEVLVVAADEESAIAAQTMSILAPG